MTARSHLLPALALALALATAAEARAQSVCQPPRVLLTLDKSSSMLGALPGGGTKWDAARTAVSEVTSTFEDDIHFGLQVFPFPDRCEPGAITIEVGAHSSSELLDSLGAPPPSGGNYTPMAQTLDVAADYAPLLDPEVDAHLVLITDGWQWCDPHDPATRFTPVDSVTRLRELGVTVHVVGFGAAVDSLTLNRAAVAGGTAFPGCDPTLSDPAAAGHCYHQANDLVELRAALDDIARRITDEMCDGFDNDCDGLVDEGYDADADGFTVCGTVPGAVGLTDPLRVDCDDAAAAVHPGAAEVCNGVDDDCDGTVDPGCACTDGETRACGSDVGACRQGRQTCTAGTWGGCLGALVPMDEDVCDGFDEDCDGEVDEDGGCGEGAICVSGACEPTTPPTPVEPTEPPVEEPGGAMEPPAASPTLPPVSRGGCGCSTPGSTVPASFPAMLAFGLFLLGLSRFRPFE